MDALTEKKIQEYINYAIEFSTYDNVKIRLTKEDVKRNVFVGKRLYAIAKYFINKDLEEFIKLLDNDNIAVAEMVAECLYPLYPKKCMKIYKKYLETLPNGIERFRVETIVKGNSANNPADMEYYKKLFNCDDLSKLNREK